MVKLAWFLVLSLAACSGANSDDSTSSDASPVSVDANNLDYLDAGQDVSRETVDGCAPLVKGGFPYCIETPSPDGGCETGYQLVGFGNSVISGCVVNSGITLCCVLVKN
jgi:hypothetical protein